MLDPHLLQQLRSIEQNYDELIAKLQSPVDLSYEDLLRTHQSITNLEETVNKFRLWKQIQIDSIEIEQLFRDSETDRELYDLANIEVLNLKQKSKECERELQILLLPKDPHDDRNVILEVQARTGGYEAEIWASDLVRIYTHYAENQSWKVKLVYTVEGEIAGFKVAMLEIIGDRVYGQLKFESGIHEVQRYPLTELTNKKMLTSAATISVMPEVSEGTFYIPAEDLEISHYNYGFRGHPRPREVYGCDLHHKPTGISILCYQERTQRQNKERALQIMRAKLYDLKLREQQEEVNLMRRSQVGTGSRSEKIRTYNYKDNRVTDHRLGHNFGLAQVLFGDLEEVIQSCISQDRQERLTMLFPDRLP
ncbi:PCRF domain-containing protein [Chamaesiphon polymorphus]|uniref:Peptide chain release factor 1 n=1 Tax=Chamaesiphon polymorphus CCALA 037 TaxID=2107692 RepID=A0A2T1GLC1_9CYAN|nr:PCRF domain-containing protein [Chamaesiphon polymorphus]PSB58658.1 peptide chain release factor 1 [Chamaesiphon polymorphus CCALA 037]